MVQQKIFPLFKFFLKNSVGDKVLFANLLYYCEFSYLPIEIMGELKNLQAGI